MLKQRNEQIQFAVRMMDIFLCILAFFVAYWIRNDSPFFPKGALAPISNLAWMLGASIALHLLTYTEFKFYESLRLKSLGEIIAMVLKAAIVDFFVLGTLVFLFQEKTTSRFFFVLFLVLNVAFVLAEKIGARALLSSIRKRGYNFRQVLVVGTGDNARRVIESLIRNKRWGYVPCGILAENGVGVSVPSEHCGLPILGQVGDLRRVAQERTVDEVYFAQESFDAKDIADELRLCEKLGIPARVALGLFHMPNSKVTFGMLDEVPILTYYTTLMTPFQVLVKRSIDIVGAMIGLLITAILYPWISWRIRRESPGPVIFKQYRIGENGRRFKCYKFRTMVADADVKKAELLEQNLASGPIFKLKEDPRVFPFGKFLRKSSLDELPQFLNVLRGDMSLVGTRPPTPDEVEKYETHYRRRLSIRPGLTGLWQVSGRSEITQFEDILKLDLQYIDQWSLWLDLRIIAKTVWVMVFGRGAF